MNLLKKYKFIKQIKALPFVEEIWLYGSRARGDNEERSDIDLAVVCPKASEDDWYKVREIVEEADTLLKIDCIRFDELSEGEFKKRIEKEKVKL